jgi:phage-related holin
MTADFETIKHFFARLFEYPGTKVAAGVFLWLIQACFGSVFRPAYGVVIILWLTDTATGYYHARANPEIVPCSRRLYHGLVKLAVYYFLLFLGFQCSRLPVTSFVQTVIEAFIILTESYSICENIQKIALLHGLNFPLIEKIMAIIQGKIDTTKG